MGAPKKKPSSKGKGKDSKGTKQPKEPKQPKESKKSALPKEDEVQALPQERVAAVRPFWETNTPEQRAELLTLSVADLRERAALLTERYQKQAAAEIAEAEAAGEELLPMPVEPTLSQVLEEGLSRLQTDKNTWKVWQWPADDDGAGGAEFFDAESFRAAMEEQHLDPEHRALLPKDPPGTKPVEKPAEAALRTRMSELLQQVHAHNRQLQEEAAQQRRPRRGGGEGAVVRDANVELITTMLAALEKEHEFLYHTVLFPVTSFVCEVLAENQRESSRTELFYEDLDHLPPDELARICEWITEKIDGFSAKLKPEAKDAELEEEDEGIGDVDLFTLEAGGERLAVNSKWLGHLAERQLGEDGHPRKVGPEEDPYKMGLVLEWVYGTIVSTAEKARDGAKRTLVYTGGRVPTARGAHEALVTALADQASWSQRATQAKDLLAQMLASRRGAAELAKQYDIRPQPPAEEKADEEARELPDPVIMEMLRREVLLTRAKLHGLCYDQIVGERRLRSLKTQLRQGEPEFDRLKRELEEVKNAPRGLEGTFRSAAEMERHRAAAADAAIEEQLEVQTSFRQHGARLQGIYDKRQRMEVEMAKRDQELKQLQGWRSTVQSLLERFQELTAASAAATASSNEAAAGSPDAAAMDMEEGNGTGVTNGSSKVSGAEARALVVAAAHATQQEATLQKLRQHFQRDVRKQLYTDEDDRNFFAWIQNERKQVEERLAAGAAALQHLVMALVNTACDDPGAAIGVQLALPLLQERLDALALEHATKRAAEAEAAIVRMDEERREREAAARERKVQAKAKSKGKVRSEKERLATEKEAAALAERAAAEEATVARQRAAEEERARRAQEMAEARAREDAVMEARRAELLKEEDGYWSQRMAREEAARAQFAATQAALEQNAEAKTKEAAEPPAQHSKSSVKPQREKSGSARSPAPDPEPSGPPDRPRRNSSGARPSSPPVPPRQHFATNGTAHRGPSQQRDRAAASGRAPSGETAQRAAVQGPEPPLQNGRRSPAGSGMPRPRSSGSVAAPPVASSPAKAGDSGKPAPARPVVLTPSAAGAKPPPAGQQQQQPQQHVQQQPQPQSQPPARPPPVLVVPPKPTHPAGSSPVPPQASSQRPRAPTPPPTHPPQAQQPPAGQAEGPVPAQPQTAPGAFPPPHAGMPDGPVPPPPQQQQPTRTLPGGQQGSVHGVPPGVPPPPPGYYQQAGSPLKGPPSPRRGGPPTQHTMPPGMHMGPQPPPHAVMYPPGSAAQMAGPPPPHGMAGAGGPHMGVPPQYMMNGPGGPGPGGMAMPQMAGPHSSGPSPLFMNGAMGPPHGGGYPAGVPSGHAPAPPPHHMLQAAGGPHQRQFQPRQGPDGGPGQPFPRAGPDGAPMPPDPGFHVPGPHGALQQQQHQQQHFTADPQAPPPPPGTPPLPQGGTPKRASSVRQQQRDGVGQQPGAPPAPTTPTRRPALRAAAQPFVPRATAPAFVPGGGGASSASSPGEHAMPDGSQEEAPAQQQEGQHHAHLQQPAQVPDDPSQARQEQPLEQQHMQPQRSTSSNVYVPPHLQRKLQPQGQQAPPVAHSEQGAASQPPHASAETASVASTTGTSLERQWSGSEASSLTTAPPSAFSAAQRHQQQPQQPQQQQQPQQPAWQPKPQQQQGSPAPSAGGSAVDLQEAAAQHDRMQHSASQPALPSSGGPRWSSVAARSGPPNAADGGEAVQQGLGAAAHPARLNPGGVVPASSPDRGSSGNLAGRRVGSGGGLRALSGGASPTRSGGNKGSQWDGGHTDRLRLVRGLLSESGQNNCFLNVIIQCLWHLSCFRGALLAPQGKPPARGPSTDRAVMDALHNIFCALAEDPMDVDADSAEAESPSSTGSSSSLGAQLAAAGARAPVSPAELRRALGGIASGAFRLSEMHDAAEVLGEIFACLHRAEAGATEQASDPQLPRRVRPGARPVTAMANGTAPNRGSMVQQLFGLEVQAPCPPDFQEPGEATPSSIASAASQPPAAGHRQPRPAQAPRAGAPSASNSAGGGKAAAPTDVLQYWKYCHNVPAQGLRIAYDTLLDGSFEDMLREADAAELVSSRAAGRAGAAAGPALAAVPDLTLLRRPRVFTLGIVWESPQAPADAIASTVAALHTEVDLGGVFARVPAGPRHVLRCCIAYCGHHYQAYALSEELGRWLLFDDEKVKLVGGWPDVAASMRAGRHQPSLLFYERMG